MRNVPFCGNEWFGSVNALHGHHLTRRDDIIQLVYSLVFAQDGFQSILTKAQDEEEIRAFKLKATAEEFCAGPNTHYLTPILEVAMAYKFEETPNYQKLKFLMSKVLIENFIKPTPSFIFDQNLGDLDCDADADEGPR